MIAPAVDACWSQIGVAGDGSCPELARVVHCRHCAVYVRAGRQLLDQPPPPGYLEAWAHDLVAPTDDAGEASVAVVVFALGPERLALPARVFEEVCEPRPIRRLPHRSGAALLGLVNVDGEIQLCVSLAALLGVEPAPAGGRAARLALIEHGGDRWACPLDDVGGVQRIEHGALRPPPATLAHDATALTAALFDDADGPVALLDSDRLFSALRQAVA